jgi:tripartite-type tricarboxylate transporter receptor subunit TctC
LTVKNGYDISLPMLIQRFAPCTIVIALLAGANAASGQAYPSKPVRVLTSEAGGGSDFAARLMAQAIAPGLGQQIIVENRGGGMSAAEVASKSVADGYTLLSFGSTLWLLPLMRDGVRYDAVRDFAPVSQTMTSANIIVVHPSLPVKSVKDLIALARARPGQLNYGTSGTGGSNHLAGELFKAMAGVDIVQINYRGAAPAMAELIGGQLQVMFPTPNSASSLIKAGKLKALAIGSAEPSALFPGLPTVASSGLPGYESASLYGMLAPVGTPASIVQRLNQEMVRALRMPELKEKLLAAGIEPVGSSPEQFAATIKDEIVRWGKVIKSAGIRTE